MELKKVAIYLSTLAFVSGVNSQSVHCCERFNINSNLPEFWFNVYFKSSLLKSVVIVEGVQLVKNEDFLNDLKAYFVKKMNVIKPLPTIILNSIVFTKTEAEPLLNKTDVIQKTIRTLKEQLFIAVFDSLESLNFTIYDPKWYVFWRAQSSYFIIVIASREIPDVDCSSDSFVQGVKEIMGNYFDLIWKHFNLIEVLIFLPLLCNCQTVLKYDFIEAFENKNFASGVTTLTREYLESTPFTMLYKFNNFKKYPLRVNAFNRIPTLVKKMPDILLKSYLGDDLKYANDFGGLDGFILGNLIKALNFQPLIQAPNDDKEYGYKYANGTFSGSLNDIIQKRMDISFNARFVKLYYTEDIEFTYPIFYDQFCVLAPKALQVPQWISIFLIFSLNVWALIFLSLILSGFVWWLMRIKQKQRKHNTDRETVYVYFIDICLIFLSNPVKLPTLHLERIFITFCLLFNLIVAGVFQGQLSTAYSTISYYSDIDNLEDLDKSELMVNTRNKDIFGTNVSAVGDRLSNKIIDMGTIKDVALQRKTVVVERRIDAGVVIQLNFTGNNGAPKLHIVEQCPRSYHLAYIVYKGFPFLKHINIFLSRIVAAGLNNKWYYFTDYSLLLKSRMEHTDSASEKKLRLLDVQGSFMLLGLGLMMSTFVYLSEIILYERKKRDKTIVLDLFTNISRSRQPSNVKESSAASTTLQVELSRQQFTIPAGLKKCKYISNKIKTPAFERWNYLRNFIIDMFLLVILSCTTFTASSSEVDMLPAAEPPSWTGFSANITMYLKHTPYVNVIEAMEKMHFSYDVRDFHNFLIKYLQSLKPIPLNLFKPENVMCFTKNCSETNRAKTFVGAESVLFFIYDSHNQIMTTLDDDHWSIFGNASTSVFFIISMEKGLAEIPCSSQSIENATKQKFALVFHQIWLKYHILEMYIYLPQFCGSCRSMQFDPLEECSPRDDCSRNVQIITGEQLTNRDTFSRSMNNFKKYPLHVNVFQREPTLVLNIPLSLKHSYYSKDIEGVGYLGGIDGFFIGNLVKTLNFTAVFSSPADQQDYGMRLANGSLVGSLADIAERRSDISINARFFKLYKTDNIEFTHPIAVDRFCLISRKAERMPLWLNILQAFDSDTWYLILGTIFLLSIIWWIYKTKLALKKSQISSANAIIDIFLLIINYPINLPVQEGERVFITVCLFFNLLFVGIFQGYLTTAYTTIIYLKDINTLQEVYDTGLQVATSIDDLFGINISPLLDNLGERILPLSLSSITMVESKNVFAVERFTDAKIMIERNYTSESGIPRLHVVQECPRYFYLNYIVYKGYPFLRQINQFITNINAAGLPDKWYEITRYSLLLKQRQKYAHEKQHKILSLSDMQAAFFVLVIGLLICILIFLGECLWQSFKKSNKAKRIFNISKWNIIK